MMLTWLPYYFETVRGFEGGLAAYSCGDASSLWLPAAIVWGTVADRSQSRDFVLWICLPAGGNCRGNDAGYGFSALTRSQPDAVWDDRKLVFDPVLTATVSENAPPHAHGFFLASFNLAASLAMVVAPSVTGLIAEKSGNFNISFFMAGAFHFLALLALRQARRSLAKLNYSSKEVAGVS